MPTEHAWRVIGGATVNYEQAFIEITALVLPDVVGNRRFTGVDQRHGADGIAQLYQRDVGGAEEALPVINDDQSSRWPRAG